MSDLEGAKSSSSRRNSHSVSMALAASVGCLAGALYGLHVLPPILREHTNLADARAHALTSYRVPLDVAKSSCANCDEFCSTPLALRKPKNGVAAEVDGETDFSTLHKAGLVLNEGDAYRRWAGKDPPRLDSSTGGGDDSVGAKQIADPLANVPYRSAWVLSRTEALSMILPEMFFPNGPQKAVLLSEATARQHLAFQEGPSSTQPRDAFPVEKRARLALEACDEVTVVPISGEKTTLQPAQDICLLIDAQVSDAGSPLGQMPELAGVGGASPREGSGLVERFVRSDEYPVASPFRYTGRLLKGSGGVVRNGMTTPPAVGRSAAPQGFGPKRSGSRTREVFEEHLRALYVMLPAIDELLQPILQQAASSSKHGHIVSMAVNHGQSDLLLNCLCSMQRVGISTANVIVFTADDSVSDIFRDKGVHTFHHPAFGTFPTSAAKQYGDRTFAAMMLLKSIALWLPLRLGYDTLFQDADLVWLQDPMQYFNQYPLVDSFWMDDGARSARYTPFFANSGFMFLRSNHRTRRYAREVVSAGDLISGWGSQQTATSQLLNDASSRHGLVVSVLPKGIFIPGQQFHRNKHLMKRIVAGEFTPIVFHMCWTANKVEKLKYLKEDMKMWYLQRHVTEEWLHSTEAKTLPLNDVCSPS